MINSEDIKKLSALARIELSSQEKGSLKKDLEQILAYMDKLKEVDVGEVGELTHTLNLTNEMRDDIQSEKPAAYAPPLSKAMSAVKNGFLKIKYIFEL